MSYDRPLRQFSAVEQNAHQLFVCVITYLRGDKICMLVSNKSIRVATNLSPTELHEAQSYLQHEGLLVIEPGRINSKYYRPLPRA